jgi:NAD+ synthase
MTDKKPFSWSVLDLDLAGEAEKICARLRDVTARELKKRGLVVAISGGIDSSTSIALAVRALGADRVFALLLPERDSADDSTVRGRLLAKHLGVESVEHDIAPALEAIGCYRWRDEAIRRAVPGYGEGWKSKIVLSGGLEGRINHFRIVARAPDGTTHEERLNLRDYLQIVAATNFKQRLRKTLEYFHADRLNYAVVGTPNRLEYDQGFFVKNGDGAADVKPIAHLYKSQVYRLADYLGVPEEIRRRPPTTDTYSLPQTQEEFYFSLPYDKMDLCLYGLNHGVPAAEVGRAVGLTEQQVRFVFTDIESKRRTTRYQHAAPLLVEKVAEVAAYAIEPASEA